MAAVIITHVDIVFYLFDYKGEEVQKDSDFSFQHMLFSTVCPAYEVSCMKGVEQVWENNATLALFNLLLMRA